MPASEVPPLGLRIREERLKQGLSLRGLARLVGVSASMVSQIETGKSQPSVSTLYAITSALGISIQDVFATASAQVADQPRAVGETAPLIMVGAKDGVATPTIAKSMQAQIPGAQLAEFDTGHFMMVEDPEKFRMVLGDFLTQLPR